MRKLVLKCILFFICSLEFSNLQAQRVYALVPGITVDSVLLVKPGATKVAFDSVRNNLFYSTVGGDIYEVYNPTTTIASDTLRYTAADHGITFLQGLFFRDSVMYLCGSIWSSTTTVGKVVKATLQPNGTRIWTNIAVTASYPSASAFGDHGFAGLTIDKGGNYIYVSSGSRTSFGEVRSNGGAWPGYREVPLSSHIFKFPINLVGAVLPNDSTLLYNTGYIFASGTRNAYDMAWDSNDTLFAIDNSGERDDPEELNWLRQGKHYGFPWRFGENNNPLQNSPYDVNLDPLVNHMSGGYTSGWFADDPAFPNPPAGVTFMDPVRNFGTAADFYRDTITGQVKNASDESTYVSTFTSHRSPLGLVFDHDSLLAAPFRGDGFILSFMPGGDSTGYTPLSPWGSPCPFVDPSRELVQMKLTYDSGIDNYTMTTSNIATGFYLPVDAEFITNSMYVIENGGSLWRINFPSYSNIPETPNASTLSIYPNPFIQSATLTFDNSKKENYTLTLYNTFGQIVQKITDIKTSEITLYRNDMASGLYFFQLSKENKVEQVGKLIVK